MLKPSTSLVAFVIRSADSLRRAVVLLVLAAWLPAVRAASSAVRRHYEISSGDAAGTLREFVERSGVQIVYLVTKVSGVTTNPVAGEYTAREALELMVEMTGLVVVEDASSGALAVYRRGPKASPAAPQPEVREGEAKAGNSPRLSSLARLLVNSLFSRSGGLPPDIHRGVEIAEPDREAVEKMSVFIVRGKKDDGYYAPETTMGARVAKDLLELPSTILIAPRQLLEDLNAQMGKDVIPFIAPGVKSNGDFNEDSTIRGFRVGGALRDGVSFPGIKTAKLYDVERVEILMGPGAMLLGNNDYVGGNINYVTRRPTDYPTGSADLSYFGHGHHRVSLNASGPAYKGGSVAVCYRLTLGREGGGTAKPIVAFDDTFVGGGIKMNIGRSVVVDIFGSCYDDRSYNYYNDFLDRATYGPGLHPKLNGYSTDSFSTTSVAGQAHRNERAANLNFRFLSRLGEDADLRITYAVTTNSTIERVIRGSSLAADNYTITRQDILQAPVDRGQYDAQVDLNHSLRTQRFRLESTAGAQASRYRIDEHLDLPPVGSLAPLDARNPDYSSDAAYFAVNTDEARTGRLFRRRPSDYRSVYVQENLHLAGDRLILIGGLRWFGAKSRRETTPAAGAAPVITNRSDEHYRPYRAGVVYRVTPEISLYYSDAANVYPQAGNVDKYTYGDRQGEPLPNRRGSDTEFGIKVNMRIGDSVTVYGNLVHYAMALTNVPTDGILESGQPGTVLATAQTARGWEMSGGARAAVAAGVATVGLTYADGRSTTASRAGEAAEFVPRSYSVIAKFAWTAGPLEGLTVGATMYDQSAKLGTVLDLVDFPVTYNAFANYRIGRHWSAQVNLTNFTNERYIVKVASEALVSAKRGFEPAFNLRYRW